MGKVEGHSGGRGGEVGEVEGQWEKRRGSGKRGGEVEGQ